jgi:hypothetical protein
MRAYDGVLYAAAGVWTGEADPAAEARRLSPWYRKDCRCDKRLGASDNAARVTGTLVAGLMAEKASFRFTGMQNLVTPNPLKCPCSSVGRAPDL